MTRHPRSKAVVAAWAGLIGVGLSTPAPLAARERVLVPVGWHVGSVRIDGGKPAVMPRRTTRTRLAREVRPSSRELTINRAFPTFVDRSDPLDFGSTIYGDVRSLDPFPTVTSGTQLPFGLDGIGGFGSDVGFSAGANAALYDRGG